MAKSKIRRRPLPHAVMRAAERLGWYKKDTERLVKEAAYAGKTVDQLDGPYKQFLKFKGTSKKVKIYKDIVFVFTKTSNNCITIYPLPQKVIDNQKRWNLEQEIELCNQAILNKKIERKANMKKQIQSKYLGLKFITQSGEIWQVTRVSKTSYNNYRYNLSRNTHDGAIKIITLTSKTMKKLATSQLTVEELLVHKQELRNKKIHEYRNTAWYVFDTNGSLK